MLKSKSSRKEQISVKLALEKSNTYRGLGFEVDISIWLRKMPEPIKYLAFD